MGCVSEPRWCAVCEPLFAAIVLLHQHHWIFKTKVWWVSNSHFFSLYPPARHYKPLLRLPSFIHSVPQLCFNVFYQPLLKFHVHLGERYQKLLAVLQMAEREKTRQASASQSLQERLTRAQEETSSLQASITERSSHYQQLHNQLLEKATQATTFEKEVRVPSNLESRRVTLPLKSCIQNLALHSCAIHIK